ncbi:copper resistance CopC family protein [Bacillus horti]|uniref:Methionine-rich copper-binding protein CopC n=1 Tax=Caldalkalibacillus horti TaxID=77523 RepID=A0ABT9VX15_9BACI|nr:copper resistance CopC family protein [Bacillus horti]MDQ0165531.1 methionine-rich copper-binding protein CopC [Bacillus horti]
MLNQLRKIFVLVSLIFFVSFQVGYAHTYLQDSNPADGDVVQEELSEIVLNFETSISELSTFTLSQADGVEVELEITHENDTLTGVATAPLENGEYVVNWDIIGEDGHPIDGDFAFTVDVDAQDQATEEESNEEAATEEEEQGTEDEATTEDEDAEIDVETDIQEPETSLEDETTDRSGFNFIYVGLFVLVVVGLLLALRKKNK